MAAPEIDYRCTRCDRKPVPSNDESRDMLTVKKVYFQTMGMGGRTFRSRVVDWLCPDCLSTDADYNREKFGNITGPRTEATSG